MYERQRVWSCMCSCAEKRIVSMVSTAPGGRRAGARTSDFTSASHPNALRAHIRIASRPQWHQRLMDYGDYHDFALLLPACYLLFTDPCTDPNTAPLEDPNNLSMYVNDARMVACHTSS